MSSADDEPTDISEEDRTEAKCDWVAGCNEPDNGSGWCDEHEAKVDEMRARREADEEAAMLPPDDGPTDTTPDRRAAEQARRDPVVQTINDRDLPPIPSRIVWYQADGRNGLEYYLPAVVTVTVDSHPGDYPDGSANPLPVPTDEMHVHLTVLSPGGFGTTLAGPEGDDPTDIDFVGAKGLIPGSGSYVEHNVPFDPEGGPRTWRWPEIR